nr:DUF359 domain-containing protein [Halobacterium salinarum]
MRTVSETDAAATLPADARDAFKSPIGPVYTDAAALLADATSPIIAVGDVVTYHLVDAGQTPAVAVVDGRTERDAVRPAVRDAIPEPDLTVASEPGTVSVSLVRALVDAIADADATVVSVDGEEDLAVVPAVLAAPADATVVYGQPGEGMVRVPVTDAGRAEMRERADRLETTAAFWRLVD